MAKIFAALRVLCPVKLVYFCRGPLWIYFHRYRYTGNFVGKTEGIRREKLLKETKSMKINITKASAATELAVAVFVVLTVVIGIIGEYSIQCNDGQSEYVSF